MGKAARIAEPVLFAFLILLTLMFLPFYIALIADILIIVVFLMLDARRNKLLLVMGLRNIARKRGTTALVVGGLMIGTAIISASLAVGDTMSNMIVVETLRGYGEVDFSIRAPASNGFRFFNDSELSPVIKDLRNIQNVESVHSVLYSGVGLFDNNSDLFTSSITLYGTTSDTVRDFGGIATSDGSIANEVPISGHIYMNEKAANSLDAKVGHIVLIGRGYAPRPYLVERIVQDKGFGFYGQSANVFMNIVDAQSLCGTPDQTNMIMVSIVGKGNEGLVYAKDVRGDINRVLESYKATGLAIMFDKKSFLDSVQTSMSMLTSLFLVFGSFAIISGIVLIINIFTMLAEERKSELGMARAIGLKRKGLRRLFLYEGTIYAAVAAGVGAFVGLGLAYIMIWFLGGWIQMDTPLQEFFYASPLSISLAYMTGFLITIFTIFVSTFRLSKLNIVRAIRNIPEPEIERNDRRMFHMGAGVMGIGIILLLLGMTGEIASFAMTGLSSILLSLGFLLRRRFGDRISWNVAGILTLIIWLPIFNIFPYPSTGMEMFVISGIFMVSSSLLIVIFNSDPIVRFFTSVLRFKGGYRAVVKTSMSYPLKAKFRTSLSIFIFGLIIYTVTTLGTMTPMVEQYATNIFKDTSGGFEIMAFSNPATPIDDFWGTVNNSKGFDKNNVTGVVSMSATYTKINYTTKNGRIDAGYRVYGFDSKLYTVGDYALSEWDKAKYSSERDVWEAVLKNESLAIIDGSMSPGKGSEYIVMSAGAGFKAVTGDKVTLLTTNGTRANVTIVGVMRQFLISGIFLSKSSVNHTYSVGSNTMFLVNLKDGLSANEQSKHLRRIFLYNGLETIQIMENVKAATSQVTNIFGLFEAFLALGLGIGLAGLGIVTIRSIYERRLEIGMMRALGFRKKMVVANFALESSFVAIIGILIGTILGIFTGFTLWKDTFSEGGVSFSIPWLTITIVTVVSILITIASIFPAARGASKVSVAQALRVE